MSFVDISCRQFVSELSSGRPVPGGGGATALCASMGAALASMVGQITVSNKSTPLEALELLKPLNEKAKELSDRFLRYIDDDADAFSALIDAYKMPKATKHEQELRENSVEHSLSRACAVPLELMKDIGSAIELLLTYESIGAAAAISDIGAAALLCKSALQGASLNVYINTKSMKNRDAASAYESNCDDMLKKYLHITDEIYEKVLDKLCQ
jgi:formiminotetrahydrofolate cyclodeaminase